MPQMGFCVGKKQNRAFCNETQSFMLPEMFCDVSLLPWKQRRRRGCPGSSSPSLPVPHTQPRAVVAGLARREHSPAGDHFCPVEEKTGLLVMPTDPGHLVRSLPTALQPETSHPSHTAQAALAVPTQSQPWHMSHVCASSSQQLVTPRTCVRCLQLVCVIPIACSSSRGVFSS